MRCRKCRKKKMAARPSSRIFASLAAFHPALLQPLHCCAHRFFLKSLGIFPPTADGLEVDDMVDLASFGTSTRISPLDSDCDHARHHASGALDFEGLRLGTLIIGNQPAGLPPISARRCPGYWVLPPNRQPRSAERRPVQACDAALTSGARHGAFRIRRRGLISERSVRKSYSYAKASIGSLRAAFRAGYKAPRKAPPKAMAIAFNTQCGVI